MGRVLLPSPKALLRKNLVNLKVLFKFKLSLERKRHWPKKSNLLGTEKPAESDFPLTGVGNLQTVETMAIFLTVLSPPEDFPHHSLTGKGSKYMNKQFSKEDNHIKITIRKL